MTRQGQKQKQSQKQNLQQKLSPRQIQYVEMLQLTTAGLEQRLKEELEMNPVLEQADPLEDQLTVGEGEELSKDADQEAGEDDRLEPVDRHEDIDWDSFMHNTEYDGESVPVSYTNSKEWLDLPDPYHQTLLEDLEQQVSLLDLTESEELIADQILGSLDEDGYFRRDLIAVADNISFNHGVLVEEEDVDRVRKQIQRLEPVGIASIDIRDCLLVQLELSEEKSAARRLAYRVLKDQWEWFEKKHYDKLIRRLDVSEEMLKEAIEEIRSLDPRPGAIAMPEEEGRNYIEPDFEVWYEPIKGKEGEGDFVIRLNNRNSPPLRISPRYEKMWEDLKRKKQKGPAAETRNFIKGKMESAQWFIESIRQRRRTMMQTMKTIVALQEEFFKYGDGLKPMILKDIAERVRLDISTISRVVNGKYVQTRFGVFELKHFFSEGLMTDSGEEVSSHEVRQTLQDLIDAEDKRNPMSDQELTERLRKQGYQVARRTVSKYREQLQLPVARLRRQMV